MARERENREDRTFIILEIKESHPSQENISGSPCERNIKTSFISHLLHLNTRFILVLAEVISIFSSQKSDVFCQQSFPTLYFHVDDEVQNSQSILFTLVANK